MGRHSPARRQSPGGQKGPGRRKRADSRGQSSARREQLNDNYYYELPQLREFEDISSYTSEDRRKADRMAMARRKAKPQKPYRVKRRMSLGKKLGLVLTLVLVSLVGLAVYMFMGLKVTRLSRDVSADASVSISGVKNIALFGLDARDGENEGRSDVTMVLTVDSRSHTLKMASLMRDSEVYIEGYGYEKLAHAYAYGGPELAVRTINQNFRLDIEDYVTVNFYDMAGIVDAFGGVELELSGEEMREVNANLWNLSQEAEREGTKAPIRNSDYFTALDGTHNMIDGEYTGGKVLLNGAQAVAYARIRHLDGDEYRTGRQQRVLMGLVAQAKDHSILRYPGIVHGVMPHCETSLGLTDLAQLAPFAMGSFEIETITLPGENEGAYGDENEEGQWVYRFDEDLATAHLHEFIFG